MILFLSPSVSFFPFFSWLVKLHCILIVISHSYWVLTFKDDIWGVTIVAAAIWEFFIIFLDIFFKYIVFKGNQKQVQHDKMKCISIMGLLVNFTKRALDFFDKLYIYMTQWLDYFLKFHWTGVIWEITEIMMKNLYCTFWLFNFGSVFWPTKTI